MGVLFNLKGRKMKKKNRTSKVIITALLVFLLIFTIVCLWLFHSTGEEPSALIGAVFVFCGGECGILGWIRTTKEHQIKRKEEIEDRRFELKKGANEYDNYY